MTFLHLNSCFSTAILPSIKTSTNALVKLLISSGISEMCGCIYRLYNFKILIFSSLVLKSEETSRERLHMHSKTSGVLIENCNYVHTCFVIAASIPIRLCLVRMKVTIERQTSRKWSERKENEKKINFLHKFGWNEDFQIKSLETYNLSFEKDVS